MKTQQKSGSLANASRARTKLVSVWHVEYCYLSSLPSVEVLESYADAERFADGWRKQPDEYSCIAITGPHQHKVPS